MLQCDFFMSKRRKSFALFSLPIKVADHLRREAREYWLAREQRLLCDGVTIVEGKYFNNNNNNKNDNNNNR